MKKEDEEIIANLVKAGLNDVEIAERMGIYKETVARRRRKLGLKSPGRKYTKSVKVGASNRVNDEQKSQIREYMDNGKSPKEIADAMGLNYKTVYGWIKKIQGEKASKPDMSKCKDCKYSCRGYGGEVLCDYIGYTNVSRGFKVGKGCKLFEKRTGKSKRLMYW